MKNSKRSKKPIYRLKGHSLGSVFTLLFCAGLSLSVFIGILPLIIAYWYILISLVTFTTYAIDKSAARNGRWRTSEKTLHTLALLGGWPGAYFAQTKLRHKSSKKEFKRVYWFSVLLNLTVFFWLFSEPGIHFLRQF